MKEGRIYSSNGALANFSETTMFAINTKGNRLFIRGKDCTNCMSHPYLRKGKTTWCAGHMATIEGKVDFLSYMSGHYLPELYHLYTFAEFLKSEHYFTTTAKIEFLDETRTTQMSVEGFLAAFNKEKLRSLWSEEVKKLIENKPFLKLVVANSLSDS